MRWTLNLSKKLIVPILLGIFTTINCISLTVLLYPMLKKDDKTKDGSDKKMPMVESLSNIDINIADYISEILAPPPTFLPLGDIILVCVIEMITPSEFWIRVGVENADLDYLRDELTEYYNKVENRMFHDLKTIIPGQMVAVNRDDEWHRGKVISVLEDSHYEILFVDEGGFNIIFREDISELRMDMFNVGFQVVKCALANTKPGGDLEWSSDACSKFCSMINECGHLVLVKIKGIKHENGIHKTPIVCVDLYGLHGSMNINIGKTLKHLRLAQFENDVYLAANLQLDYSL